MAESTSTATELVDEGQDSGSGATSSSGSGHTAEAMLEQVDARWRATARRGPDGTLICTECGLPGHPCCGQRYWNSLRAAWLRVSEEQVAQLPASFEDAGPLQLLREGQHGQIRELSEGEVEDLEDCLDAVQRPFPLLRFKVPLGQAVQCAEALWDGDD